MLAPLVIVLIVGMLGSYVLYDRLIVKPSGVAGTVTSPEGRRVVRSPVVAAPLSDVQLLASGDSITDDHRNYRLLLPPGRYRIEAPLGDAPVASQQVEVTAEQITTVDITVQENEGRRNITRTSSHDRHGFGRRHRPRQDDPCL